MNTQGRLHPGEPICLGGAVPSSRLYILDDYLNLVPPNTIGHIFIGGVQMSKGYINMPERTVKEFLPDPFVEQDEQMYRTGDLGYFDHQGKLWYCSRNDRQVKIRGYRVNLDDISHAVYTRVPSVRKAVAVSRNNGITLFVTPAVVDTIVVKGALQASLPPHYQPSRIHALHQIPLLKNGKIDLKGLASLVSNNANATNGIPDGQRQIISLHGTQKEVGDILKQILHLDSSRQMSESDDFFALGGDSISMLKLAGRLNEMFQLNVNVRDILLRPTLQELASFVDQQRDAQRVTYTNGVQGPQRLGISSLSPPELLWVHLHTHATCKSPFNVPYHAKLSTSIDLSRLVTSVETTLNRHRILRSQFHKTKTSYKRTISEEPITVTVKDSINLDNWINQPFSLDEALVRVAVTPSTFLLNISHILCDYGTLATLLREIEDSYRGKPLKSVSQEYFDETTWRMPIQTDLISFWDSYFEGIALPRAIESRPARSYNGASITVSLFGRSYDQLLAALCRRDFTFQQFGLGVVAMLLQTLGAKRDLILGCAYLNCPPESQNIVGLHLEPLPVRLRFSDETGISVRDILRAVAASSESALAHFLPWHHLLSHLGLTFPSDHNEIFDCAATFHDSRGSEQPLQSVEGIMPSRAWPEGSLFSVLFEWTLNEQDLVVRLAYDADRFSSNFMRLLEQLLPAAIDLMLDTRRSYAQIQDTLSQVVADACAENGMDVATVNVHSRKFLLGATSI